MDQQSHHQDIVSGAAGQFAKIFNGTTQSMYIYLDDNHAAFNKNFLSLLGYLSNEDIMADGVLMLDKLVEQKSQRQLVAAYQRAMEQLAGSTVPITWMKKSGEPCKTSVIMVPIIYQDHLLALHFIEPVKSK